ncbi:MAG TPA: response regulator, partial [Firmicutes bacterium]|nr:response regulator [Bacillota bacterium]
VLVVDDAPTLRTYISEVLKRAGYDVTTATDGADALEKLREVAVDLVISDLEMPRMNGDELVVEIKKREDMRTLPVILLTAQTDAKHRRAAAALGVAGYLTKPFDEARLLRAVSELVVS